MRSLFGKLKSHVEKPLAARGAGSAVMKVLASVGILGSALAYSGTSHAVTGLFRIAPAIAPAKSFDLPGGGCPYYAGNNPSTLALYTHDNTCSSGDQMWWIQDMGNGTHEIRQGGSGGKCLDIDNAGAGNGIGTYTCTGVGGQRFILDEMVSGGNDGLYGQWRIKSSYDGRVIDLANASTDNGTQIRPWSDNGSAAQRWILWGNGGMHPDFQDDFSGNALDGNAWTAGNIGAGRYNNEQQRYAPSQVAVWGGHMTITASDPGNCTGMGCYVSGRVNSKGKRWYRNGMFSARVHYWENAWGTMGTWPAFWILGNNINENPYDASGTAGSCWPTSGARELDIWEWVRNKGGTYTSTAIYNGGCGASWPGNYQTSAPIGWNQGDWVVASVKIDGGRVKFYNGGIKTADYPDTGFANEDFSFIFNLAVGGDLGDQNGGHGGFYNNSEWASIDVDWATHETW